MVKTPCERKWQSMALLRLQGEVNPHINLRANYIKIADATTPGSVKAIATITFSYQ
ncbi:fimbrial protein [Escherichia coli]